MIISDSDDDFEYFEIKLWEFWDNFIDAVSIIKIFLTQ